MQILDAAQHQALAYVAAANRGGYRPAAKDLHEWMTAPRPQGGHKIDIFLPPAGYDFRYVGCTDRNAAGLSGMEMALSAWLDARSKMTADGPASSSIHDPDVVPETFAAHLVRLGWLEEEEERSSLGLTPLGRALLRTAEAEEDNSDVPMAVVLGAEDELAYPMLIRRLVEARRGLLIDPYLRLEQLLHVRTFTQIQRVLISPRVKAEDQAAMAVLIESDVRPDERIEVRVAGEKVLHDRLIVGEGFVDTIGTSMNTVGRQHTTVLTPLPSQVADTMREYAVKWWTDAKPLAAWPPREVPDEHVVDDG